jgi:HTH-type transcriptional regulator / antitoxin HipB
MKENTEYINFEDLLEMRHGKVGSTTRNEFELKSKSFIIGEMIKEERKQAKLTQDQLAEKAGTKKSYISRIENGNSDIQLSTLFRIIETGLGKRLDLNIF